MKTKVFLLLSFLSFIFASASQAELDLDQEVLIIPDTHNEKPYIWEVTRNPKGYELSMDYDSTTAGADTEFRLTVNPKPGEGINNLHVFVTDKDLHTYKHIRPAGDNGRYNFVYNPPIAGKYRFEVVFKTATGWVNLRKDIAIKSSKRNEDSDEKEKDEGYSVKVKLLPKKIYAEHVVTFLYEISYKGRPLKDIEKIDGADMQVASWDEDLKEFIFATPKQNLGGPEVAVSIVFMKPGSHAVFAEFKHNGAVRKVAMVVDVNEEPREDKGSIFYLKPSD